MKEDLPNDGLERFLKKSFEGYEDTPKGDLWDKISGDLDAPVGGLPKSVPIYKTWWARAAAALFAGVITAQFLYFQNRINNLSQEVDNQKVKVEKIDYTKEKSNLNKRKNATPSNEKSGVEIQSKIVEVDKSKIHTSSENSIDSPNLSSNFEEKSNDVKTSTDFTQNAPIVTVPPSKISTTPIEPEASTEKNKQVRNADKLPNSGSEGGDLSPLKGTEQLVIEDEKSETIQKDFLNGNLKNEFTETAIEQLKEFDFLPFKSTKLLLDESVFIFEKMPDVFAAITQIKPIRNKRKGISVGFSGGLFQTTETIKGDIRADFRAPPPNRHFIVGFQNKSTTGTTQTGGLNLKIDLNEHWSLISGVMYRKDVFNSENVVNAKFRDFGPGMRTHQADFFQHTTGGTISTEIRIETTDGGIIHGDERVKITSQLTHEKEYISLPLALNYGLNRGDWHFNFGGGILYNKLISSVLKFDVLGIDHPRIKRDFLENPRDETPRLQSSNLDGMFNVGIEYDLTDHFSLALNPTILFDLTKETKLPNVDSDSFSIGINLGVNYNF